MRLDRPIDHAAFVTWDVQATHDFYVHVMGWPLAAAWGREDGTPPFFQIGFDAGGWLLEFEWQEGLARPAPVAPSFPHLAFAVDASADVDGWEAHVAGAGVPSMRFGDSLYFTDPNDLTFQVYVKEPHGTPEEQLAKSRANLDAFLAARSSPSCGRSTP